jgi:uncharacterized membrane protein YkoI
MTAFMDSSESARTIFSEQNEKLNLYRRLHAMWLCGSCSEKAHAEDLPAPVQAAIQSELKGGEIRSIGKETEDGVAQYEIETIRGGKHRDFNVDTKGKLLVVEEETTFDSIPAAAKAAIMRKAADGKLGMVELFMRNGETMYEAAYTTKAGKKHEVLVKADGTETKD